jgi:hypothetical protein
MKKILGVLTALVLLALWPAVVSAVDLRQNADGTADWVSLDGRADFENGVSEYTAILENLGTESTVYFAIPVTGTVFEIYSVLDGAITSANETLRFDVNGTEQSDTITITQSGSAAGDVDSATGLSYSITAGQMLAVGTTGSSGADVNATITVRIRR